MNRKYIPSHCPPHTADLLVEEDEPRCVKKEIKPPLWAIAYTAYYGKLFDWRHTSADKKRRFAKVARAVAKQVRRKK